MKTFPPRAKATRPRAQSIQHNFTALKFSRAHPQFKSVPFHRHGCQVEIADFSAAKPAIKPITGGVSSRGNVQLLCKYEQWKAVIGIISAIVQTVVQIVVVCCRSLPNRLFVAPFLALVLLVFTANYYSRLCAFCLSKQFASVDTRKQTDRRTQENGGTGHK